MATIEVVENFSDPYWRLNNLYWIVDKHGRKVPFRFNPTQQNLYDNLWFWNLILKSRQHGMTTVIDIMGLDQALFNNNYSVGICAHTREDVEKIFRSKVKFPYDNLPEGLKNARAASLDTAKMLSFSNGSTIEVATSLRSGTYQFGHVSEFGKICARYPEKAREIVTGTFETLHPGSYLFVESTAEGRAGYFYRYVTEAIHRQQEGIAPNKLQFKLHFYAWFEDSSNALPGDLPIPENYTKYFSKLESLLNIELSHGQRLWYITKAATLDNDITREHPSTPEEAFEAAISGAYLSKQMSHLRKNGKIGIVPHDPSLTVNSSWDFGLHDTMSIWFHQKGGLQHRLIGYMHGTDDDVLYYWREMQRKPYIYGHHYLPHDAATRRIGSTNNPDEKPKTIETILSKAGMKNIHVVPKTESKWTAIQEVRLSLPKYWIDKAGCADGVKGLDNFRREWDEKAADWKNRPYHNWAMHPYDSLETLIRGIAMFGCDIVPVQPVYCPEMDYEPFDAGVGM